MYNILVRVCELHKEDILFVVGCELWEKMYYVCEVHCTCTCII